MWGGGEATKWESRGSETFLVTGPLGQKKSHVQVFRPTLRLSPFFSDRSLRPEKKSHVQVFRPTLRLSPFFSDRSLRPEKKSHVQVFRPTLRLSP